MNTKKTHRDFITNKYYTMLTGGILSSIIFSLLLMASAIIAGIFIGEEAVAGINLVKPLYSLALSLGMVFSLGVPILYARASGKFNRNRANRVFGLGLTATIGTGLILFLLLFLAGDRYLAFFDASPGIIRQAREYTFWMRFDILLLPLASYIPAMVFADGDEKLSVTADIVKAVGNILISMILAGRMGIAGIGIGSLIGTMLGLSVCMIHFFKKRNSLRLQFYFSGKLLLAVIQFSAIDAGSLLFLSPYTAFLNKYMYTRYGADMLILVSVITFVTEMQFFMDGIGEAITPIMTIYLSERCYAGVDKIWKIAKRTSVLLGLVAIALLMIFAPLIPTILGITDPRIVAVAIREIRIMAIGMPFISLLYVLTSYYVLAGKIMFGFIITALYEVVLPVPLIWLLGHVFGIDGTFSAIVLASIVTWFGIMIYVCVKHGKDEWPLFLGEKGRKVRSYLFDFSLNQDEILAVRTEIEEVLKEEKIDNTRITLFLILFEDMCMEILDKNPGRQVNGECAIVISDKGMRLIEMDDGRMFRMKNEDQAPDSWRAYVLSQLISRGMDTSIYLKTMSFNRNMFEIKNE